MKRGVKAMHDVAMRLGAIIVIVTVGGVLASACGSGSGQVLPVGGGTGSARPGYSLADAERAARADAARRTGLAPEAFELVSAERVTWSDGSLGCPQPDLMYTQALVPGYRIRLRGPAGLLDYHGSLRAAPVWCPTGRAVDPLPGQSRV